MVGCLTYDSLIDVARFHEYRKKRGVDPLIMALDVRRIPIHPRVLDAAQTYTPEHYWRALMSVKHGVTEDLAAIHRILGQDIPFEDLSLDVFTKDVRTAEKRVDFGYGGAGIGIDVSQMRYAAPPDVMLPADRISEFSVHGQIPVWYTHTPDSAGIMPMLYLRSFAIQFNNLCIDHASK